jgi:UDP-GlcNAc:undecaprenyl-phosphate GlcNAc-1-phosphate transferase
MPISAGIGIYGAVAAGVAFFDFELLCVHFLTALAIFLVFVVGVLDDHRDAAPKTKFIVMIVSTLLLFFDGIVIDDIGTFFGYPVHLGVLALPFTIFAVSGFTNALNLIDGLDGLSSVISITILTVFAVIGYRYADALIFSVSMGAIAVLAAFLVFNWHPASIFMGDSGSLTLGFLISVLSIRAIAYIPTVSILFIAAVPILDTLVVMIRRKRRGKSVFSPDRCHIHHILFHFFGDNTRKTVFTLGVMQAVYSLTGLQLEKEIDEGVLLVLFVLNVLLLYLFLGAMVRRQGRDC